MGSNPALHWCFTVYRDGVTVDVISDIARRLVEKDAFENIICQVEQCPETGRFHIQGYCQLVTKKRMAQVKEILCENTAHLEVARDPGASWDYCGKEDSRVAGPWSRGSRPGKKGERNDLKRAWELVKGGASDATLFEEVTGVAFKYQRGIQAARAACSVPRDKNVAPEVQILWGPSGTGKSRRAIEENPEAFILTKPSENGTLWWDGYSGQKVVIIDEFYGWIKYDFLLRILDRYPLRVQVKGGSVDLAATKFVFTSNKQWEDWYLGIDDVSALRRRIVEFGSVIHME